LGRERLEARARRLPAPPALLQPAAQRLDEAGERLKRALSGRIVVAGSQLARQSGRLSLPLLAARLERARERLAASRLTPALLSARHAADAVRLQGVGRVLASLNPDTVLARGYARVTGADGRTLVSRAAAAEAPALTLHFRDGTLGVVPGDALPPRAAAPRPAPPGKVSARGAPPDAPKQGDLF
jgi:exodeoxyribonuclease VII large subunit